MRFKSQWNSYILIFSSAHNISEAEKLAEVLVTEKLVACVNLISGVKSVYWWKQALQHEQEVILVMKTRRKHFKTLAKRIRELHSYEVPEIIALPIYRGSKEYLNWIYNSVKP